MALLGLTGHDERLPYKVAKTNTYWRSQGAEQRKRRLIKTWRLILDRLGSYIDDIDVSLPDPREHSFDYLKRFEDAIDGLVCAWVATQYLSKDAVPLGDKTAAIWVPKSSMRFAKEINGA